MFAHQPAPVPTGKEDSPSLSGGIQSELGQIVAVLRSTLLYPFAPGMLACPSRGGGQRECILRVTTIG
eukprot:1176370-Prorocentrum_minimum.AAC.2